MKKLIVVALILLLIFVALGIAEKLPAGLQNFANQTFGKIFPIKKQIQERLDEHAGAVDESVP